MKRTEEKLSPRRDVTLIEAIRILRVKIAWILLWGVLAAAVMGAFTAFFVAPTYSTYTTMYIYTSQSTQNSGTITGSELQAAESMAQTCREILLSDCVLTQVCDAVKGGLDADDLTDMLQVSTISGTQLLKIQVTTHDPQQAQRIAQAMATVGPAEILRITKAGGVEIVDSPKLPEKADGPHVLKNAIFALLGGWVAASVYFLLQGIYAAPASRPAVRTGSNRARRHRQRQLRQKLSSSLINRETESREHNDAPAN